MSIQKLTRKQLSHHDGSRYHHDVLHLYVHKRAICARVADTRSSLDYMPVYFQATLGSGPLGSSVKGLPSSLIVAPFALVAGLMVHTMQKYKPAIALGWVVIIVGFGILSMMKSGDPMAKWVGYQVVAAMGTGLLVSHYFIEWYALLLTTAS